MDPGLSLEAWRRYARPRVAGGAAPRRGILALEDQRGCILTLMEYHVETDLHDGRILRCTCLAGVDLLNPRAALRALVRGIRQRAEAMGCEAVHVTAPRTLGAGWLEDGIKRSVRGLAWQAMNMRRRGTVRVLPPEGGASGAENSNDISRARASAARRLASK